MKDTMSRKKFFNGAVVLLVAAVMVLPAMAVMANTNGENEIIISHEISFSAEDVSLSTVRAKDRNVYDVIEMADEAKLGIQGSPDLPCVTKQFVIPTHTNIKDVGVEIINVEELPGTYNILPAQEPIKTSIDEPENQFVYQDKRIYKSAKVFPGNIAEIVEEGFFGNDHIVNDISITFIQSTEIL